MVILSILISTLLIFLSYFITHKNISSPGTNLVGVIKEEGERRSQYECGLETFEEYLGLETRERFYIKFYIIGILFLIFDIETLLLYPITLIFFSSNISYNIDIPFIVFLIFILILLLGLFYEYRKDVA